MNERLEILRQRVLDKEQRQYRQAEIPDLLPEFEAEQMSWMQRAARLTQRMCASEQPVIFPEERIVFTRTIPGVPPLYTQQELALLLGSGRGDGQERIFHELGPISNICANWNLGLSQGLLGRRTTALAARQRLANDPRAVEFLDAAIETIDAVLELARRYAAAASAAGQIEVAEILERVPEYPARGFHEALQSLRLLHAVAWLSGHYHVGLGRFDQYMLPYLQADLQAGKLDLAAAEELLVEFFISLNKDSDLYPGVQQGDNGQTLTLGGITPDGRDGCNELTWMALRAALEVSMIDPKINLRISPETDLELLTLASKLTRKGLGFPQYSNDAVVIPALAAHGYDLEDARDDCVAACWEFIIPGRGMEVVNIGAVSFPYAADQAIRLGLQQGEDFPAILERMQTNVQEQVQARLKPYRRLLLPPAPYYSIVMNSCLENGSDLSNGLKYNNFGIHGAASSNAADALAAVKQFVFDEGSLSASELLKALEHDYYGADDLRLKLLEQGPKVGRNSELADEMLVRLFDALAQACEAAGDNGRGGIVRPGTGSAMYYLWLARGHSGMREPLVGATADGRRAGEPFSANLAPAPGVQADGLFSLFQSYSKIDYRRICNGGPVTIELSDSVFRDPESLQKVAMLVRTFAQLGLQQLQLNSLNAATLQDARLHPENHRNLIVRVWGWSGYFCELAPEYQEHVVQRALYA